MKKQTIFFFILLLAAALLGWVLPGAVFRGLDNRLEAAPETVEIRQIDLSYQSDLQFADRLHLTMDRYPNATISRLERGVYRDPAEIRSILQVFLQELTAYDFRVTERNCDVEAVLLQFEDQGAFVAWEATVFLNEVWSCEVIVDDQTGAILCIDFEGNPAFWDSLFHRPTGQRSSQSFMCQSLQDAMLAHYRTRLEADYSVSVLDLESGTELLAGTLVFYENTQEAFRLPFFFVFQEAYGRVG